MHISGNQANDCGSWGKAKSAAIKGRDGKQSEALRLTIGRLKKSSNPSVAYSMQRNNQNNRNTLRPPPTTTRENGIKPSGSYSVPLRTSARSSRPVSLPHTVLDEHETEKLARDIDQARQQLLHFRSEMEGLAKQMDGIAIDLETSKDRVMEIEHDITTTQEVNVDLQVLLENAVRTQKESEGKTTNLIRHMHSNLANIAYENSQLQERLASIELHQQKQQGTVIDVGEKMREYAHMLEQAQGTLQVFRTPRPIAPAIRTREDILNALSTHDRYNFRRASDVSSIYMTEDEEVSEITFGRKQSESTISTTAITSPSPTPSDQTRPGSISPDIVELYRHRIIRRRPSLPGGGSPTIVHNPSSSEAIADDNNNTTNADNEALEARAKSPQRGLQMLFKSQGGQGFGLSSLATASKSTFVDRSRNP